MVFESSFKNAARPDASHADQLGTFFWSQLDRWAHRVMFVDYTSGREWTGCQIKERASQVASYLKGVVKVPAESHGIVFYKNCDTTHFISLGLLFAGVSTCYWYEGDLQCEKQYIIDSLGPRIVFCSSSLLDQCLEIRTKASVKFTICVINDDQLDYGRLTDEQKQFVFGFKSCIENHKVENLHELPVRVSPSHAAYVLMTSGSTGLPKPVGRSHRNSLYACHSLNGDSGRQLWSMDENSVLSGLQELNHGTGTFAVKTCMAKGLKLIIMNCYDQGQLLEAVNKYKITDSLVAFSHLHNLMTDCLESGRDLLSCHDLSSWRNIMVIGGRLTSPELRDKFEQLLEDRVSVRTAYGMVECGFIAVEPRDRKDREPNTVGLMLPFTEIKLVDLESGQEMTEPGHQGELFIRGPQVAHGYLGKGLAEQQRAAFLPDGSYKSNDIGQIGPAGHLTISGRRQEILNLWDGWKVLPGQIEAMVMEMPEVHEAAVIGVPDDKFPGSVTIRAYVVLKPEARGRVTESDVQKFVASRTCEAKHLRGGVKLMTDLPRVTLGKVDKRALRQMDGY